MKLLMTKDFVNGVIQKENATRKNVLEHNET